MRYRSAIILTLAASFSAGCGNGGSSADLQIANEQAKELKDEVSKLNRQVEQLTAEKKQLLDRVQKTAVTVLEEAGAKIDRNADGAVTRVDLIASDNTKTVSGKCLPRQQF